MSPKSGSCAATRDDLSVSVCSYDAPSRGMDGISLAAAALSNSNIVMKE